MSVAKLAERTKELGHPISVNTITDLELGRRSRLEVTELLVLASCLEVPPAALLFQVPEAKKSEPLPGNVIDTADAVRWLVGYPPLFGFTAFRQSSELVTWTKTQFDIATARAALDRAHVRLDGLHSLRAQALKDGQEDSGPTIDEIAAAERIARVRAAELDDILSRPQ